jgi:FixJ family two-component response regulator
VLELIRRDPTLRDVAAELGIGVATAERHLGSARRKLSARRIALGAVGGGLPRKHNTTDGQEVQ